VRLNWFSPLPPARTDIAHFTARILPALAAHADVTLWTAQSAWDANLETYAGVRHFEPGSVPWSQLNAADATFYNIGNDARYHVEILQVARRHGGIPILHDVRLHELFAHLFRWVEGDREGYVRAMERTYGAAGRRDALLFWHDRVGVAPMAERYPLASVALQGASGALVHTMEALEVVRGEGTCPVLCPPLPYPARNDPAAPGSAPRRPLHPPYRLVIFGYLHHNRRLDAVLRALAGLDSAERAQLVLDIFGELWDEIHVRELISTLRLDDIVSIHGFVPEEELDDALGAAHLAINLRYPSMGEASGSQLRIWDNALPSLVSAAGMYARLPEESVAFVRPAAEIADLQRHLRALLANPRRFLRMGEVGRQLLAERHSPEMYARAVTEFASTLRHRGARSFAFRVGERAAGALIDWLDARESDDTCRRVARELHAMTSVALPLQRTWARQPATGPLAPEGRRASIRWESHRSTLAAGTSVIISVRVRNQGTLVWPALAAETDRSQIKLAARWLDARGDGAGYDDVFAALPHDIPPGDEVVLALAVPTPAVAGAYILELEMLQEGVGRFAGRGDEPCRWPVQIVRSGALSALTRHAGTGARTAGRAMGPLPAPAMRAAIDVISAPGDMYPGSRALVRARIRNCGDAVWPALGLENGTFQINLGDRWADRLGRRIVENDARAALPHDLAPGEEVIVPIIVHAPDLPGEYRLELDMVQEDVSWFEFEGSSLGTCPVMVSTAILSAAAGESVSA
jgi:glycosyltransferase involved in cell wall biosynthesis